MHAVDDRYGRQLLISRTGCYACGHVPLQSVGLGTALMTFMLYDW